MTAFISSLIALIEEVKFACAAVEGTMEPFFFSKFYFLFFYFFLVGAGCVSTFRELSGPVCKSTWRYFALYCAFYLHFSFVIDFLSI